MNSLCGWLPARFVLQPHLKGVAKYLVNHCLPCILLLVVSSRALGAGQTTRCFSVQEEVLANGNGQSLGYYRADARITESAGSALVSFSVSMPDTPQVLLGEDMKATPISPTTYKFRFIDGWGNHSKGQLTISGKRAKLNLKVERFGHNPSNITRNYGESTLYLSSCQQRYQ